MDYLQIANSWPVWLCAGACVAFIVVQAVAFAKLCYKNAPLVGYPKLIAPRASSAAWSLPSARPCPASSAPSA